MPVQRPKESIPAQTQLPAPLMVVRMRRRRRRPKTRDIVLGRKSVADWAAAWVESFALDKNCWVYAKLLLHSTITGLALSPFPFWGGMVKGRVECSIHFAHTQQFLSNAKLTLGGGVSWEFSCILRNAMMDIPIYGWLWVESIHLLHNASAT